MRARPSRRAAADDGDGVGVCRGDIWSERVVVRPALGGWADRFRRKRSVRSDFGAGEGERRGGASSWWVLGGRLRSRVEGWRPSGAQIGLSR